MQKGSRVRDRVLKSSGRWQKVQTKPPPFLHPRLSIATTAVGIFPGLFGLAAALPRDLLAGDRGENGISGRCRGRARGISAHRGRGVRGQVRSGHGARACVRARRDLGPAPADGGTDPVVAPPRAAGANSGGRVTTRRRVSVRACGRAWLAWLVVRFRLLTFSSLRFSDCDGRLPRTGRPAPSSFFSALLFNGQTICVLLYNPV